MTKQEITVNDTLIIMLLNYKKGVMNFETNGDRTI